MGCSSSAEHGGTRTSQPDIFHLNSTVVTEEQYYATCASDFSVFYSATENFARKCFQKARTGTKFELRGASSLRRQWREEGESARAHGAVGSVSGKRLDARSRYQRTVFATVANAEEVHALARNSPKAPGTIEGNLGIDLA